ncbi:MAG: ParB N-terminal domain-containing protein [Clostridia bacterium]|nr:ParB N-terminal domain-containing protein [Clostridia bacterium]
MAKINLKSMDLGLAKVPVIDPLHDTQTLLNRSLGADADDYRAIPLGQIAVNPQNDYAEGDSEEDIIELAMDIERNGLLHNIVVSDRTQESGQYLILSGERRFRAYSWLYENRRDNKYAMILCKVLTGLEPLDEMLVLDAANLQTRGGMGDERRFRKATVRFIENLRKKGGVSEEDAKTLAVRYTGVSEKLFDKNLTVEQRLHPAILALLDRDLIPKNQAVQYARLSDDVQSVLAENLNAAYESGSAALRDVNDQLAVATKTIAELTNKVEQQEKGAKEIEDEISEAQLSLSALNALAEEGESSEELSQQIDVVRKTLEELESQKRMYSTTITSAKAALRKSEEKLSKIGTAEKTGNALKDDVAAMVNKSMKKAETGVSGITSRTSVSRILKMDASGRTVMLERLTSMRKALDEAITRIEDAGNGGNSRS